jgi:hypothetical protein
MTTKLNRSSGRRSAVASVFAVTLIALFICSCGSSSSNNAVGPNDNKPKSMMPDNDAVQKLVKDTTAQFAQAIDTEDFSTLYNNSSQDFQATYNADQMKSAFGSYIEHKAQVLPVLNAVQNTDAEFSPTPSLRTEKGLDILLASGRFDTKPYNVRFDNEYVNRGGVLKLLKLVINIP